MSRKSADLVLEGFRKRWGDKVAAIGDNIPAPERVPTGVLEFDIATGGGVPKNCVSCFWGEKDTGKSILLYKLIATYQAMNPDRIAALMDLEQNYDTDFGTQFGIDEERLLFLQPDYGEQAGDMILHIIKDVPEVGLICVDSLAWLIPKAELDKSLEEHVVASGGLMIARLCKKTSNLLMSARKQGRDCTVVYTNQMRMDIGKRMGDPSKMPGGKAAEHAMSTIVRLYGGKEKVEGEHDSNRPVKKNVRGVVTKKKGPILCRNFEYDMAVVAHAGLKPGDTDDWRCASGYMKDLGLLGKRDDGKGWQILAHEFPTQKACREWYEGNRHEARKAIVDSLFENPEML